VYAELQFFEVSSYDTARCGQLLYRGEALSYVICHMS
jgi:hypothetical protein